MVTYTTVNSVANLLGYPDGYFTLTTQPTSTVIESFIEAAEDEIDAETGHAWRSVTITGEKLEPMSEYRYGTGIALKLRNRSIISIDKLEIWDGSSNVDWKATKTEGRNADYWVDYKQGIIYLVGTRILYPNSISCDYKFGETTIPKSIKRLTSLKTALIILESPEFSTVVFTEASQNSSRFRETIESWKKEIQKLIDTYSEFKVM